MAYETDSATGMVERVGVVEMPARGKRTPPPQRSSDPPTSPPVYPEPTAMQVAVHAFAALGYALSARALLLLALIGMFVIAVMALVTQAMFSLYILLAFGGLTVLPFAVLEIRRRSA